jgi:molybdopterin-guanine dinucleotide biosynthesis protein A
MDNKISCAGIILAGGKSSRFGSPKALAKWKGKTFFERTVETLIPHAETILTVTREDLISPLKKLGSPQIEWITDVEPYKGKGPLAGIYSAMLRKKADFYLVSPCDMPLMSSVIYEKWLDAARCSEHDCVIPVLNGKVYPLNGVYRSTCLPDIKACLNAHTYKVLKLLERKRTLFIEVSKEDESFFENINTQKELLNLKKERE